MMGMVRTQVLSQWHLPWLTCVGLLLFVAVFLGAVLWVCRRESRAFYAAMERLPFDERSQP
jgi:hypothetical protein